MDNNIEIQIEEVKRNIMQFVQNIVDEFAKRKTEYLKFIYSETVNTDELLACLNKVRFIQSLYSLSGDIINNIIAGNNIRQTVSENFPYTKEKLLEIIDGLQNDINCVSKKIQQVFNESINIDDEEEYNRVQSDMRAQRKKFRSYEELFIRYHEAVEKYVFIDTDAVYDTKPETEIIPDNSELVTENEVDKSPNLTEKAFFDWLVTDGGVSKTTAIVYISNIHRIENLYQDIYSVKKKLLGAVSADDAKIMIKMIVQRNEYNNNFDAPLSKFAQFAGISIDKLKTQPAKKNYQPPVKSGESGIKTVDFENFNNFTYYKPCSFTLNEVKYPVKKWRELYTTFLQLIYNDNTYTEIMKSMIAKSLYGRCIDFADKTLSRYLRSEIKVSDNFYAEGNLSAEDTIRHIKCIMELCSIDNDNMIIEYYTDENSCKDTESENIDNTSEDYENPEQEEKPTQISFTADTTKQFVLKDALIEILSSNSPEIASHKKYKNGVSLKSMHELLKQYYKKRVENFEILKVLNIDKTFQHVGKGYYVLNPALTTSDFKEPVTKEADEVYHC